jgi:hypothetical protein
VAGRNLAEYGFAETSSAEKNESEPFDLFEDFNIGDMIKGNETWEELLAYRQTLKRPSLSFYIDKVARKRWLPSQGFEQPKQFFNAYKSELTTTHEVRDEAYTILWKLPNETDYVAKPTHQSTSYGAWIVGHDNKTGAARYSMNARKLKKELVAARNVAVSVAEGLLQSLYQEAPCFESWALFNVQPGTVVEERFSDVDCEDCPPDEFNLFTIWGRVWLANYVFVGEDKMFGGFIHRNGTIAHDSPMDKYPAYVDFPRMVKMAEELGANKDMFRTDIFVGVPSGAVRKGATKEERLAAVKHAVSECEIYPTTPFDYFYENTTLMQDEGARLWIAGYKMGNYRTVPNTEVPNEFINKGGRMSEHDDFKPFAKCKAKDNDEPKKGEDQFQEDKKKEDDQCQEEEDNKEDKDE